MQKTVEFKVAAVSSNTSSFGLYQMFLVSRDGLVFTACKSDPPRQGEIISIPVAVDGVITSSAAFHFEIPHKLEKAPKPVVDELWATEPTTATCQKEN